MNTSIVLRVTMVIVAGVLVAWYKNEAAVISTLWVMTAVNLLVPYKPNPVDRGEQ